MLGIARRLEAAGYETWCVGGAVRDALLGLQHLDWDLATAARPEEVRRLFRRTVPVGIQFGTVGVLDDDGVMHEVTTFRRDVRTDGRHAEVEFGASLEDDLARRDFTINAIAFSPSSRRLFDPFGGQQDLAAGLVRAVGEPEERMREDRLRALRALRFASRFGFRIEPSTWTAIVGSAPHLTRLSPERVKQELEKTMEQVQRPGQALRLWQESGALGTLVPDLAGLAAAQLDTLDYLPLPVGRRAAARKLDRLTALFLQAGAADATRTLKALKFSNHDIAWIAALADHGASLGESMTQALLPTVEAPVADRQLRRWAARVGRLRISSFLRIWAARWAAHRALGEPAPPAALVRSIYRRALRVAFRDPIAIGDLAVDGEDLKAAGVPSGPRLGKLLQTLLDEVIDDPARNTREWLLARARELTAGGPGGPPTQET